MSDLLKAILAMDSYNRGYNSGINLNQYNPDGSLKKSSHSLVDNYLGDVKIFDTSTRVFVNNGAQNIGFYGIAYQHNGEVIISYPGTDENVLWEGAPTDLWEG